MNKIVVFNHMSVDGYVADAKGRYELGTQAGR
jgi:hypothetical protein